MSNETQKKRKRPLRDATDELQLLKSRIVEAAGERVVPQLGFTSFKKPIKDGKSRQEKSERRSKSMKQTKAMSATENAVRVTTAGNTNPDQLANIKDFVPFSEASATIQPARELAKASVAPSSSSVKTSKKPSRTKFIVFVGNLPYSTTTAQIASHFSKLSPTSVRHSTEKTTGLSKGFAFLEFEGYDKMKTCLKLYHHSVFDPSSQGQQDPIKQEDGNPMGQKGSGKGRKINVELTVGGGGRGKDRKEKLRGKNLRLEEQRERAIVNAKENEAKDNEANEEEGKRGSTGASGTSVSQTESDSRGDIHPSRLNRVAK